MAPFDQGGPTQKPFDPIPFTITKKYVILRRRKELKDDIFFLIC